jgi:glycosyltransferase involved in cell wall biosynthesis
MACNNVIKLSRQLSAMPKVSVIIPFYSNSLTIERAICSILMQTIAVYEIIIVNDDSPDKEILLEVLTKYPDVKLLNNTTNKGPSHSRNYGVQHATGDVLCFLDADDEVHPQKIEIQLKLLTDKNAITCENKVIFDRSESSTTGQFNLNSIHFKIYKKPFLVAYRNNLTGAGMMISRDLFNAVGGYDESLRSAEDYDLWLRLLEINSEVLLIKLPLYMWYFNPSGLTKKYFCISVQEFSAVQKHLDRVGQNRISLRLHQKLILFICIVRQYYRYEKCFDNNLLTFAHKNRQNFRSSLTLLFIMKVIISSRLLKMLYYINKVF